MTANQDEDDTTTTKTHSLTLVSRMVRLPDPNHPPVTHSAMQEACHDAAATQAAVGTEWRSCPNHELLTTPMTNTHFGDTAMDSAWPVTTTVWTGTPCHGCRLSQPSPTCLEDAATTTTLGTDYFMATTVSSIPTTTQCLPREANLFEAMEENVGIPPNSSSSLSSSQHHQVLSAAFCVPMDAPSPFVKQEETAVVGIVIAIVVLLILGMGVMAWYRGNQQDQEKNNN